MLRRLLNIASIVCLVACVALMGTWVRSYYHTLQLHFAVGESLYCSIGWLPGRLEFQESTSWHGKWRTGFMGVPSWALQDDNLELAESSKHLGFALFRGTNGRCQIVPLWFAVLVTGLVAMALQLRRPLRQFSLRALFIATTFLAVVLGMITWLDRAWIGK
jgi:hypothetical protein